MKIKVINNTSRELPEEIVNACMTGNLTDVNTISEEYNLKVVEYERVLEEGITVSETYTIGDRR